MRKELIQFISQNEKLKSEKDFRVSTFNNPNSLDEFEFTFIDLSNIWANKGSSWYSIDLAEDLKHVGKMVQEKKFTTVIFLFPLNVGFRYEFSQFQNNYLNSKKIKEILPDLNKYIFKNIIGVTNYEVNYEKTNTDILGESFKADFYFKTYKEELTLSEHSNKVTTAKLANSKDIITALEIDSKESTIKFLKKLNLFNDKQEVPNWIKDLHMFDDKSQLEIINCQNDIIIDANKKVDEANNKLQINDKFKSILYTNGDKLVEIVLEILAEMLDVSFAGFKDLKKEDFNVEIDDTIFIGEVKGVSSSIKSIHVSQLDVHFNGFKEEYLGNKTIKALLIINHQRDVALSIRNPIHQIQIDLAIRNDSLIVETLTLLKLFEKFKNGEYTSEKIRDLFKNSNGLLNI